MFFHLDDDCAFINKYHVEIGAGGEDNIFIKPYLAKDNVCCFEREMSLMSDMQLTDICHYVSTDGVTMTLVCEFVSTDGVSTGMTCICQQSW